MNTYSQKITSLLHATRTDLEQLSELSHAVRDASDDELRLAVLKYSMDLLTAARSVVQLQIDVQQAASGPVH